MTVQCAASSSQDDHGACAELKDAYQKCFDRWLKDEVLKGKLKDGCSGELVKYTSCIKEYYVGKGKKEIVDILDKFGRK
ncbi:hypothetical protein BgAZ_207560 [Babesia gibsoni]|uniref:Uncharacterized protein n=1 Tax=Babesia gibsoni TaxID=33632 RepID=A0AAD8PEI2_BABGI|nr:hypothetical protein BgAZ_207560 [Babesia gibsoni]